MGKTASTVQVPGAAADDTTNQPETDPRDAELAKLRAELAAIKAGGAPADLMVMEGGGANTRKAMAESKHLGYTSAELDKLVRSGEVKLTDHHVLCRDGWYVNPDADRRGREG